MNDAIEPLIFDLLEWISKQERSYAEVMDAWRTSCPRLPVWEEANDRGFVTRECRDGCSLVHLTALGQDFLRQHARYAATSAG
ncbi:MAG TPA: hypothetical protein VL286_00780 [Rhizomicrobium sp.]|jgi:hypothetical protein|nr:hypothetical protein [Rhizomicrobium sp.]